MCLAIISYRSIPAWPLLVASNRDEFYDRPRTPPTVDIQGRVPFLAPRDRRAGGSWIGINANRIFAVITNRSDLGIEPPAGARSRGLLVQQILSAENLEAALEGHRAVLHSPSAPYNLIFGDPRRLFLCALGRENPAVVSELTPGTHFISNHGPADDFSIGELRRVRPLWENAMAEGIDPWAAAPAILALDSEENGLPALCKSFSDRGTVSSTILGVDREGEIRFRHADGPPTDTEYSAYSFPREDSP